VDYLQEIRAAQGDPRRLEELYQTARREQDKDEFRAAMLSCYRESSDNVLYAVWYYRLQQTPEEDEAKGRSINWKLAILLSAITGLVFWILSNPRFEFSNGMPYLMLVWALVGGCAIIAFLTITAGVNVKPASLVIAGLLVIGLYVTIFATSRHRQHYRDLMLLHLPLLAWIGAGISVLGPRSDHQNRFAFLIKSIEVLITGGLYLGAGGAFVGITIGMFEALDIKLSDEVMRVLIAGGAGLVPVLAVAGVYDPHVRPIAQRFQQGLGKVIYTLMRLLMPLTLLVLVIYLFVIPFNFMEPFRKREVLIVYNVMLFAVMGLLIGATPVRAADLSEKQQSALRTGMLAVAVLATLVSLYALSATVYRTILGGMTMNRLTVIGWNSINIGILVLLVYKQLRDGRAQWIRSLQSAFSLGTVGYIAWALFLTLAIPLLFKG
jgi:hypothetical protein